MIKTDKRGLHLALPFICPECKCNNCNVKETTKKEKATERLRICGQCGLSFYTEERIFGPERYICNYIPGLNRSTKQYQHMVEQYQILKGLIGANPNGREAIKLLLALENAKRKCGISDE